MDSKIENIPAGSEVSYEGDVVINGSIGRGAKIIMLNGSLTINGTVEPEVEIQINNNIWNQADESQLNILNNVMRINNLGILIQPLVKLTIRGNVHENVKINAHGSVAIAIQGSVSSGTHISSKNGSIETHDLIIAESSRAPIILETTNGKIRCGNICSFAQLRSMNGAISCQRVDTGAMIHCMNGKIFCEYVAKGANITSMNGNIECVAAEAGAANNITAMNGTVRIAGKTKVGLANTITAMDSTVSISEKVKSQRPMLYQQSIFHNVIITDNNRYVAIPQQNREEDSCTNCCTIL